MPRTDFSLPERRAVLLVRRQQAGNDQPSGFADVILEKLDRLIGFSGDGGLRDFFRREPARCIRKPAFRRQPAITIELIGQNIVQM